MDAHILIVDDEPSVRYILVFVVTRMGCRVSQAKNGREALDLITTLEKHKDPLDLVITDIQMPRMSGTELIHKLRKKNFDLPVIVISGHKDEELREELFREGCTEIILKPFDIDDLTGRVVALLEKRRGEKIGQLGKTFASIKPLSA